MVKIYADAYAMRKDHYQKMKEFGMECDPVDAYGGYVAFEKFGKDNLTKTQDSIRDRFSLDAPDTRIEEVNGKSETEADEGEY